MRRFGGSFDDHRIFAVLDEIHHCAGHDALLSNAWANRSFREFKIAQHARLHFRVLLGDLIKRQSPWHAIPRLRQILSAIIDMDCQRQSRTKFVDRLG